jgi:hypothetical protein
MDPLKLRIIIPTLEIGGAELHLSEILPSLAEKGWSIELIILTQKTTLVNKFNHKNIKVYLPPFSSKRKLPFFIQKIVNLGKIFCFLSRACHQLD